MARQEDYLEFLDFTKGLYEKALQYLQPGSDDFSILSGSILLTVGLEKLVKFVLYSRHPFMVLFDKINGFDDVIKLEKGEKFNNTNTISFETALDRLVKLYPQLKKESGDIRYIIKERNYLMHNFGYIDIIKLEKNIQTKIADMSEAICKECLNKNPEDVFTKEVWGIMSNIRDGYKQADFLEIDERIRHFQRLWQKGEILPCKKSDISDNVSTVFFECPVCNNEEAYIGIGLEWDINVDHREGIVTDAWEYLSLLFNCDNCGFTITDTEEIELFLGVNYDDILADYNKQKKEEMESHYADFYKDEWKSRD
jgi:transcription elongation factor Elf1